MNNRRSASDTATQLLHIPALHFWPYRIFHSRIFSHPTGPSMSLTRKHPLAPAYHLLWTSAEDVACQYWPHSSAHSGDSSTQPLHCQVGLASGRSLGRDWRRRPGRPRVRWTDQLCSDTGSVPANLWRQAILRCHGGATRWPELATRWRWRRRRILSIKTMTLTLHLSVLWYCYKCADFDVEQSECFISKVHSMGEFVYLCPSKYRCLLMRPLSIVRVSDAIET